VICGQNATCIPNANVESGPTLRVGKCVEVTSNMSRNDLARWRGLARFWIAILGTVFATASLLQILGPPRSDLRATAAVPAEQTSAEPGSAPPLAITGPPSGESQPADDTGRQSVAPADRQMARRPELAGSDYVAPSQAAPEAGLRTTPWLSARADGILLQTRKEDGVKSGASMPIAATQSLTGLELTIHYSAKSISSGTEASRIAARLAPRFGMVETGEEAEVPETAIVRFFFSEDHSTARAVASILGELGYAWRIENSSSQLRRSGARVIEVWLPMRPRFGNRSGQPRDAGLFGPGICWSGLRVNRSGCELQQRQMTAARSPP
jgi:hypothetical protein